MEGYEVKTQETEDAEREGEENGHRRCYPAERPGDEEIRRKCSERRNCHDEYMWVKECVENVIDTPAVRLNEKLGLCSVKCPKPDVEEQVKNLLECLEQPRERSECCRMCDRNDPDACAEESPGEEKKPPVEPPRKQIERNIEEEIEEPFDILGFVFFSDSPGQCKEMTPEKHNDNNNNNNNNSETCCAKLPPVECPKDCQRDCSKACQNTRSECRKMMEAVERQVPPDCQVKTVKRWKNNEDPYGKWNATDDNAPNPPSKSSEEDEEKRNCASRHRMRPLDFMSFPWK